MILYDKFDVDFDYPVDETLIMVCFNDAYECKKGCDAGFKTYIIPLILLK